LPESLLGISPFGGNRWLLSPDQVARLYKAWMRLDIFESKYLVFSRTSLWHTIASTGDSGTVLCQMGKFIYAGQKNTADFRLRADVSCTVSQ
jgi:hypothetical protein